MNKSKCFYCDREGAYDDVVMVQEGYKVSEVCLAHLKVGLSS